jgi:uncharacterized membrane protein YcaP (DUF421 family)
MRFAHIARMRGAPMPAAVHAAREPMFDLSTAWWEISLRAALVYGALLVMVRVSGKRTIGQFTPFDLLVVMLLSESVSNALNADEHSLPGGLLAAATLIALNGLIGWITSRSTIAENVIEGTAVLVIEEGRLLKDALRRHRVGRGDIDKTLREADCRLDEVERAYLEADGGISLLKKRPSNAGRPATPPAS